MSSSSIGKQAGGATTSQSAVPEPSFAERARTLSHSSRIARPVWLTLCRIWYRQASPTLRTMILTAFESSEKLWRFHDPLLLCP